MECPAPEPAGIHRQQIRDAIEHFAGCFVREREQQNISRIDPIFEQVRDAIRKGARFARARAGDHKDRAGRSGHGRELLFVQLSGVINVDRRGYRLALQRVLAGHTLSARFARRATKPLLQAWAASLDQPISHARESNL